METRDESFRILEEANNRRASARIFLNGVIALERYFKIHTFMESPAENDFAAATTISGIVLESLSLEQAMKSLYMFESLQRVRNNHDLSVIFDKLQPRTSATLVRMVNAQVAITTSAMKDVLKHYRNLNVDARYKLFVDGFTVSAEDRRAMRILNDSALSIADHLFIEAKVGNTNFRDVLQNEQRKVGEKSREEIVELARHSSVDYNK